jgi:hypothetical protein
VKLCLRRKASCQPAGVAVITPSSCERASSSSPRRRRITASVFRWAPTRSFSPQVAVAHHALAVVVWGTLPTWLLGSITDAIKTAGF